jgi:hypothetical protein
MIRFIIKGNKETYDASCGHVVLLHATATQWMRHTNVTALSRPLPCPVHCVSRPTAVTIMEDFGWARMLLRSPVPYLFRLPRRKRECNGAARSALATPIKGTRAAHGEADATQRSQPARDKRYGCRQETAGGSQRINVFRGGGIPGCTLALGGTGWLTRESTRESTRLPLLSTVHVIIIIIIIIILEPSFDFLQCLHVQFARTISRQHWSLTIMRKWSIPFPAKDAPRPSCQKTISMLIAVMFTKSVSRFDLLVSLYEKSMAPHPNLPSQVNWW